MTDGFSATTNESRRLILLAICLLLPISTRSVTAQEAKASTASSSPKGDSSSTASSDDKSTPSGDKDEVAKPNKAADGAPATDLLAKPLKETWKSFCPKEGVTLEQIWTVSGEGDDRVLTCTGDPKGFLYTMKEFSDFELNFEWRYLDDENGNSGVLVFTKNEPRLWPTGMQVQLHQPTAGTIFPGGDAKANMSKATALAGEIGKWNKCRIIAQGRKITVTINGGAAGEVSDCDPGTGHIALQSEGSKTEFRRLKLKVLPPATATPKVTESVPEESETPETAVEGPA